MPFTEQVTSISGRNSRASNISGNSRSVKSPPPQSDMFNAGVLSMLKTSTDTGDIGSLAFNHSRLPNMPKTVHHGRGYGARLSGGSHKFTSASVTTSSKHRYAPSQASKVSSTTRDLDLSSLKPRDSMTSLQTMPAYLPDTMSPTLISIGNSSPYVPSQPSYGREGRSYSMTTVQQPGRRLPHHRSVTSLRSQVNDDSRHPPMPRHPRMPAPHPDQRALYAYPTRLKRPGYRSPSPAFSDMSNGPPPPPTHLVRRQLVAPSRPPMQTYNSDYAADYAPESRHLDVRRPQIPSRAMSSSTMLPYEQQQQFVDRQGPMRSTPFPPMQHPAYRGMPQYGPPPPHPSHYQHGARRGPHPPTQPSMGPMAHQMFHNAARMARHLPQRTDTPMTESLPSSDPPSSGPSSSDPPTPRDHTKIQVVVDPAFIDPAFSDLPDSTSEPVIPAHYLEFAESLEKFIDGPDLEVQHPSVPPSGFVQRVKAMLEQKAADDAAARQSEKQDDEHAASIGYAMEGQFANRQVLVPDPKTPRVTIIEEFQAPVELPASPVRIFELPANPVEAQKRITRAMVQAELAASSTENESSAVDTTETYDNTMTTDIEIKVQTRGEESVKKADDTPVEKLGRAESAKSRQSEAVSSEKGSTDAANIPSSPPSVKQRESSVAESTTTTSFHGSQMSGMDYALRFSVPASTTVDSEEETNSADPFALDKPTVMIAEDQTAAQSEPEAFKRSQKYDDDVPVSPLQPGEDISRCSAVSPLHTHTINTAETLQFHADSPAKQSVKEEEDHNVPGAFPAFEEAQGPSAPRTPKTYSKSVQLPQPTVTITDTTNTNRFSLPPDLSAIGESTVSTNSDIITDVAVRFSMPHTTTKIGKPQIVEVTTSSPLSKAEADAPSSKPDVSQQRRPARNSVSFADEVAPLAIKKIEQHRQSQSVGDLMSNDRRTIPRRPSPFDMQITDPNRSSRDSTTDVRFSSINFSGSKYHGTHLPGLKEESQEDMSTTTTDLRHKGVADFQFPLPARIAAVKAMQEKKQQQAREKHKSKQARRRGRPLAEIRDLPSLNFSRMDLIDKLNEALEIRSCKSMDLIRRRDFSAIYCPSPQRPASTEALRERYTSFFSKPDEFDLDEDSDSDIEDQETGEEIEQGRQEDLENVDPAERPLSPEDFLSVATEVNRLSIPSVTALTKRLSELLPSLQQLHLDSILFNDLEVAHTIEDIQHLGQGGDAKARPVTILSNRSSAGLRLMAEAADKIVTNGTHDSTVLDNRRERLNKELPPLLDGADKVSAIESAADFKSIPNGTVSAPSLLEGGEPKRPLSALIRGKSPASAAEVQELLPPEPHPLARGSKRSVVVLSSPNTRPWNLDESYPWAGTEVNVDITLPAKTHQRDSVTSEFLKNVTKQSLDLDTIGELTTSAQHGIDIGSVIDLERTGSVTTEQLTGVTSTGHSRIKTKQSVLGSIKKKIGFGGCTDADKTASPRGPGAASTDDHAHVPGERYPTTGLTPPSTFNLDEVRSFFSDNSSEEERNAPLRKRLTRMRAGSKHKLLDASRTHSLDAGVHPYDHRSMNEEERVGANSSANIYDGTTAMGKTEFHIKRFGERLRHLFAKGGELFRSWSVRSRARNGSKSRVVRDRDDWLNDSVYSGV